jgi:hypothetical protein
MTISDEPEHVTAPAAETPAEAESDQHPAGWPARLLGSLRLAAPALALYAALRIIGLIVLAAYAHHAGTHLMDVLGRHFDGVWYAQIANHGYDTVLHHKPDGSLATTPVTFFPLFPALIALTKTIFFVSAPVAGVMVAAGAGLIAAWGIFAVGRHLFDRRVGLILVGLWAVLPHAVVESMAYTETVFTAIVAWALLALLRRQWLIAAGLTILAGLTRPTAIPLIAAVCLAALVAVIRRRDSWRPWVALVAAPIGYVGYLLWVGHELGRLDAYFYIQKNAWHIAFDGGADTFRAAERLFTAPERLSFYISGLVVVIAIALLVLTFLDRQPWPVLVYTTTMIILALTVSQYFWAKGRYLIPAFPLLLPIAVALAKSRPRTTVVVLALLTVISTWYGVYLSLVWKSSP